MAQNSKVPKWQEDYITLRFLKFLRKLREESQKSCHNSSGGQKTASRRVSTSRRLSHEPANSGLYGTAPETSRNAFSISQGTNEDDSQSDPHAEAVILHKQTTQNTGPEEGPGVHEEVSYCSSSTSSERQKKNRSTNQPQFCSENTPATIEAAQLLLAPHPLANKNKSANSITISMDFQIAKIAHDSNAHVRREM